MKNAILILLLSGFLGACTDNSTMDQLDDATESVGKSAEEATETTGDTLDGARDEAGDSIE